MIHDCGTVRSNLFHELIASYVHGLNTSCPIDVPCAGGGLLLDLQGNVTAKLAELMNEPCDEVFPEYITVMISNGKTIRRGYSRELCLWSQYIVVCMLVFLDKAFKGISIEELECFTLWLMCSIVVFISSSCKTLLPPT